MARSQNPKKHVSIKLRYLVLFLILLALLLAAVGTVAWMRFIRSLQTVTMVQVTSLSLEGPNPDIPNTAIINIGDKDVSEPGSESYVFGVRTYIGKKFQVQLAHTTNTPFRYTIYEATKAASNQTPDVTEQEIGFLKGKVLSGAYKNEASSGSNMALQGGDHYYTSTYDTYTANVQQNAAPLYWQSESVTPENEVTYFILDVSWKAGDNNKETDMVYLTVGTAIDTSEGGAS